MKPGNGETSPPTLESEVEGETMEPSGGPSPLPSSPLPASPNQTWYESQIASQAQQPSAASMPPTPPARRKKTAALPAAIFGVVFVVAILAGFGAFDFLASPSSPPANQPDVQVTSTSASHTCPVSGGPYETYQFTLVNRGSVNANVALGFYLNDAQVLSDTYYSAAGTSTPHTVTASLSSCPPSGSTYYLSLVSVTAA